MLEGILCYNIFHHRHIISVCHSEDLTFIELKVLIITDSLSQVHLDKASTTCFYVGHLSLNWYFLTFRSNSEPGGGGGAGRGHKFVKSRAVKKVACSAARTSFQSRTCSKHDCQ